MSPKKKRPTAAQSLIDSLLDERTPAPQPESKTGTLKIVTHQRTQFHDEPHSAVSKTMSIGENEADKITVTGAGSGTAETAVNELEVESTGSRVKKMNVDPLSTAITATGAIEVEPVESHYPEYSQSTEDATVQNTPVSRPSANLSDETARSEVARSIDRAMPTEVRTGVKPSFKPEDYAGGGDYNRPAQASNQGFASAEAALKQSDSLRIAQAHISELEQELEKMRRENEQLATAGETLRRRSDELLSKAERLELQYVETKKIAEEEKKVLRSQLQHKDRESLELRGRLEEMEGRLESNFKKIRVRERELEHRLEIVKAESATLVSSKDKMILDLKRQIDQLTHENEFGKNKSQELFNQYKGKQDTIRRVVRALRIALTILEGDEDSGSGQDEAG